MKDSDFQSLMFWLCLTISLMLGSVFYYQYEESKRLQRQIDKWQQRTKEVEAQTDEIYRIIKLLEDTFE